MSKSDSEIKGPKFLSGQGSELHPCHAELVSASHLNFGFDLKFELWNLKFCYSKLNLPVTPFFQTLSSGEFPAPFPLAGSCRWS